jgi:penicillin-binding protein 1C
MSGLKYKKRNVVLGGLGLALALIIGIDLLFPPNLARFKDTSAVVLGDDKSLLHVFQTSDEKWRLKTDFKEVDSRYITFLIAREDQRFWYHWGIDPLAIIRAVFQMIRMQKVISGGSTLTMQTARLLEPRPRTVTSKLIEMIRTLQLECHYSKRQILSMYFTLAPFGGNIEGIKAASLAYFEHLPKSFTPGEAALLVALPQSPSKLRPHIFPMRAEKARYRILASMLNRKILNQEEFKIAVAEPLPKQRAEFSRLIPHLSWRLHQAYPGLNIHHTTIIKEIQLLSENVVRSTLTSLSPQANIAVLVMDHAENKVRAYVGSSDFFNEKKDGQVDFICAYRSPGSTLKPFIYGLAFEEGLVNPNSLILDDRVRFGIYSPGNFDKEFRGMVTVREALQLSLNVPAVSVLNQLGSLRFLGTLKAVGVDAKFKDQSTKPTLAIALGGLGMTLEQLVMLYGGLARGGIVKRLRYSTLDKNIMGYSLLSERSVDQVTQILKHDNRETGSFQRPLSISFKTGTSYGHRDAWAIGYNANFTVGIWIGHPAGSSMGQGTGQSLAVPILQKIFQFLPKNQSKNIQTQPTIKLNSAHLKLRSNKYASSQKEILRVQNLPKLLFPIHETTIEREKTLQGGYKALPFKVSGGTRPYTWVINGRPETPSWQHKYDWLPGEPGFHTITVIDAEGKAARAHIELR